MTKLGAVAMGYDAEGQRAKKWIAGGATTVYVHDAFGQLAAEYNSVGVTPACTTCYLTYDMQGTPRLITDQNQNVVTRHDYTAYGVEIPNGTAGRNGNFGYNSNVTQGFTGQKADSGTAALIFFNARHMSGVLGGFVQPDPANAGADITSPQIGPTSMVANPLHFVYGVGGAFQHGLELGSGRMAIVGGITAARTYLQSPHKLSAFPVLFPQAVLGVEGAPVGNCFKACVSAVLRGRGF